METPPLQAAAQSARVIVASRRTRWSRGLCAAGARAAQGKWKTADGADRERLLALLNYARNERRAVAVREIFADDTDAVPCA